MYRSPSTGPAEQSRPKDRKPRKSVLGSRQPSAAYLLRKQLSRARASTGQGRVPRLEQSTQLHTNPSQPPGPLSALTQKPPHCRTGPLPLATPLVLHCTQAPTYPSAVPISLSPPSSSLKAQGSACLACPRLFCCCLSNRSCLVILHHCSLFSLHTHSTFPPINTRPTLYYCRSALHLKPCLRLSSSLPLAAASFNLYTLLSRPRGCCRCSPPEDRGTWYRPSRGQPLSLHPYDCDCDSDDPDREEPTLPTRLRLLD